MDSRLRQMRRSRSGTANPALEDVRGGEGDQGDDNRNPFAMRGEQQRIEQGDSGDEAGDGASEGGRFLLVYEGQAVDGPANHDDREDDYAGGEVAEHGEHRRQEEADDR